MSKFTYACRVTRRTLLATAGLAVLAPQALAADAFPSKSIRWIVPYTVGGSYDRLARGVAPILGKQLGVSVVVQNVPGADGYNRIYRAPADGYTIGNGDLTGQFASALVRKPLFQPGELTWLGRANAGINLLVASKASGITSIDDLKAAKKPVRFASFGFATPTVQIVALADHLGIPLQLVNYRGPRETLIGVVRGDTELGLIGTRLWLKHIKAGNVVPLLTWDAKRDPRVPGAPTLQEIGAGTLLSLNNHRSIIAPPGLPKAVHDKLVAGLSRALASPEGKAFLKKGRFEDNPIWGDDFGAVVDGVKSMTARHAAALRRSTGK
jgi:tripartite-type tricarboxylate transporter receptor subunit TctC